MFRFERILYVRGCWPFGVPLCLSELCHGVASRATSKAPGSQLTSLYLWIAAAGYLEYHFDLFGGVSSSAPTQKNIARCSAL